MKKQRLNEELSKRNPMLNEVVLSVIMLLIEKEIITPKELLNKLDSIRR